tara:strand:- start:9 stop:428 length:420 start_codon:yes stop_codon:yes gene_type:complete
MASILKVDQLQGIAAAKTITVTVGASATQSLEQGLAKAWVNFNGTGTPATRDSLNFSTITDSGTGIYEIAYTSNMGNVNYAVTCGQEYDAGVHSALTSFNYDDAGALSTSELALKTSKANDTALIDSKYVMAANHGDLA